VSLLLERPLHRVEVSRREFIIGIEEAEPVALGRSREFVAHGRDRALGVVEAVDLERALLLRGGPCPTPGEIVPVLGAVGRDQDANSQNAPPDALHGR
jgi:hypothetical protein